MASLVYRNAVLYESAMLALYGRHYFARYRAIADLIPEHVSVLDVCCGPAHLYHRYLKRKGVQYCGLDINQRFIDRLRNHGGSGEIWDVASERELPLNDYVLMHASLYHFLTGPVSVIDRMLRGARRQVIIAEPIRNLADRNVPLLSRLARRHTDPGSGRQPNRFTEKTLDALFAPYRGRVARSFLIPGGREKVYVLNA